MSAARVACALAWLCAAHAATLEPIATLPLPQARGRIDHLALDAARGRLFVVELGAGAVEAVDLAAMRPIARVDGLDEPQGVAYVAASDRVLVAEGGGSRVALYDGGLAPVGSIATRDDPDNLRLDPSGPLALLGEGSGEAGALALVDPARAALVAGIAVGGHPEAFAAERGGARVFVNVPERDAVVVVDRVARTVVATWPLPAGANFPIALDERGGRLFVGCRRPATILVLDATSGAMRQRLDGPGDVDDLWFDEAGGRVYASGGDGTVVVAARGDDASWSVVDRVATAPGARTSLLDAAGRRLIVAAPARDGHAAELRVYRLP